MIELWPEGVPGKIRAAPADATGAAGLVFDIEKPILTYHAALPVQPAGTAVIVCPGGGYACLALAHEGRDYTRWLNQLGVSVFVLHYRLRKYGHPAPLQDVLRAIRIVRSMARFYDLVPDRVGIMGASAGGHLAACAGTLFNRRAAAPPMPALDRISARPDFMILQYPLITMQGRFANRSVGKNLFSGRTAARERALLSVETKVTGKTPPTFLVATAEDTAAPLEHALRFYQALRRAKVPAELHLYAHGPHGFGMDRGLGPASGWPKLCEAWLRHHRWI